MPFVSLPTQRLAYRETGSGRPALLLLHGAGGSSLHFAPLLPHLGRVTRALALDLPGHGRSPALDPAALPSALLERYRDLVAEAAERLGLGRFVLVGHSMGGAVALLFALAYPERLERLVLVATGARLAVSPELLTTIRDRNHELPQVLAGLGYSPASEPRAVEAWAARQIQAAPEVVLADFRACSLFDVRPLLGAVRTPTTIIAAADDRLTPMRLQQQLAAGVAGACLRTVERAGHFLLFERPLAAAQAMLDAG